jgi:hypothetical protein
MKISVKTIALLFLILPVAACMPTATSLPNISIVDAQKTAVATTLTDIALTRTAMPAPSLLPTFTPEFIPYTPSPLPSTPPTPISPYAAEHREIKKVIAAYFDHIYAMHHTFRVEGLGEMVSTGDEARGFVQTELRKQALDIVWARLNALRYASYEVKLDFSEIVVFDSGRQARANFTEGHAILYELSIPHNIVSQMANVRHIMMLRMEADGWKIIYDVHDDYSRRSLYAPTPFPQDVLNGLDKRLIELNKGQGGPALPPAGKFFLPADPAQLQRWKEYETALAETLLPQYPRDTVLCEWELTARLEQKLNVWSFCMTTVTSAEVGNYYFPAASLPAVLHLDVRGTVQRVEVPEYGEGYLSDLDRLFPDGAWKDLPNVAAMEKHLHWRRTHPEEPPLVVLNTEAFLMGTPTVSPIP